jgi:phospholipid transport system substrate-binding protein
MAMSRLTKSIFSIVAFAIFVLFAGVNVRASAPGSPSQVVERFQAALLQVMKEADKLSVRQRGDRLAPIIEAAFHIPLMAQIAAASHWQGATSSERVQLVSAFRRMSFSTLATLFNGYDGETFNVMGETPGPQNTLLVMTKLTKADKSTVAIAYVTRKFEDGWRIIDVIVDNGISELKVRRSEYAQVLGSSGPPGLIKLLNTKADELLSK